MCVCVCTHITAQRQLTNNKRQLMYPIIFCAIGLNSKYTYHSKVGIHLFHNIWNLICLRGLAFRLLWTESRVIALTSRLTSQSLTGDVQYLMTYNDNRLFRVLVCSGLPVLRINQLPTMEANNQVRAKAFCNNQISDLNTFRSDKLLHSKLLQSCYNR